MFKRIETGRPAISLLYEDHAIPAFEGDSVAAALLAVGIASLRDTPASGAPRGPYCMMGVCFDCLVEIDGVANRQACLTAAADGMVVRRQRGARELGL